jgi:hypothetical protein
MGAEMANLLDIADKAIAAYDASIFPGFDANKSDLLALSAALDCDEVVADARLPNWTRDHYRDLAAEMRALAS